MKDTFKKQTANFGQIIETPEPEARDGAGSSQLKSEWKRDKLPANEAAKYQTITDFKNNNLNEQSMSENNFAMTFQGSNVINDEPIVPKRAGRHSQVVS